MCFFRVDAGSAPWSYLDEDNVSKILKSRGKNISPEDIRAMDPYHAKKLAEHVNKYRRYELNKVNFVQLPSALMDKFGDIVVVIKDEAEFKKRVLSAVEKQGGHCVMGDIRYHRIEDRVDPSTLNMHSVTAISSMLDKIDFSDKEWPAKENGFFHVSEISGAKDDIYWRGCLDKYDNYEFQNEWRICWLPEELNYHDKELSVGRLDDIIEIKNTEEIRTYLIDEIYKGYIPGSPKAFLSSPNRHRRDISGTETYETFMERMKNIDGMGDFVFEIC